VKDLGTVTRVNKGTVDVQCGGIRLSNVDVAAPLTCEDLEVGDRIQLHWTTNQKAYIAHRLGRGSIARTAEAVSQAPPPVPTIKPIPTTGGEIDWTLSTDDKTISYWEVDARPIGTKEWGYREYPLQVTSPRHKSIYPNMNLEFRIRSVSKAGVSSEWSALVSGLIADELTSTVQIGPAQTVDVWGILDFLGNPVIKAVSTGDLESGSTPFVSGSTGWQWGTDGVLEANNSTIRGTAKSITLTSGDGHVNAGTLAIGGGGTLAKIVPVPDNDWTINNQPFAAYTASPQSGEAPLSVVFEDRSWGSPDAWLWDFGDGSEPSTEQSPTHIYTEAGTFTPSFQVSKGVLTDTTTHQDEIVVSLAPPPPEDVRVTTGLQSLYYFTAGAGTTIADTGGVGAAYNLTIPEPAAVTWGVDYLEINANTDIKGGVATKIIAAIQASSAFTIDAWIEPGASVGTANARIIALDSAWNQCNTDLIQVEDGTKRYSCQILTNLAINQPYTPNNTKASGIQHVAVTFDVATSTYRFYVNGLVQDTETITGDVTTWYTAAILHLGCRFGGTKPWLGRFYLVGVYSAALTDTEVLQNFKAGYSSTPVATDDSHYIEFLLQKASSATANDGIALLLVDGLQVAATSQLDLYDMWSWFNKLRMGAVEGIDAGTSGTFYLDELLVNTTGTLIGSGGAAGGELIDIDHELGTLAEYNSTVTDGGKLSAHADAAQRGTTYGMKVVVDSTNVKYGQATIMATPSSGKLRVRFYIDMNAITMGSGEAFTVLYVGRSVAPLCLCYVALNYTTATSYFFTLHVTTDDGGTYDIRTYQPPDPPSPSDGPNPRQDDTCPITLNHVFVDGANGKDTNAGTLALPWKTIATANLRVTKNMTVNVRVGTYDEQIKPVATGTATEPIVYRAYGNEKVIIRGTAAANNMATLLGDYTTLYGFAFATGIVTKAASWVRLGGTHNTVMACTMFKAGDPLAMVTQGANDVGVLVTGTNSLVTTTSIEGMAQGININAQVRSLEIRKSTIGPTGSHCIITTPAGAVFQKIWIHDNTIQSSGKSDGVHFLPPPIAEAGSSTVNHRGVLVQNNVIRYCCENAVDMKGAQYCFVDGNVLYGHLGCNEPLKQGWNRNAFGTVTKGGSYPFGADNCIRRNILFDTCSGVYMLEGYKVYNNTFVNLHHDYLGSNDKGGLIEKVAGALTFSPVHFKGTSGQDLVFVNNIVSDNDNEMGWKFDGNWKGRLDYNLYYNPTRQVRFANRTTADLYTWVNGLAAWQTLLATKADVTGDEANSIEANPVFVNVPVDPVIPLPGKDSTYDFSLRSTSPALNEGGWLTQANGEGSGTSLTVDDARFFHDGFGFVDEDGVSIADTIVIGTAEPVQIKAIDYTTNKITLVAARTWADNAYVYLNYEGTAPNIGAWEGTY
jgi:PKD repeat protein